MDGSGNGYPKVVGDHVHLNPVRAGLIGSEEQIESYRWSSHPLYVQDRRLRTAWLRIDRLLGEWRIA